ncbi:MAG: hypothetical protein ACFWT0_06740 [Bifidobacterium crudilactis]|jgi:hypothetical protein
MTEWCDRDPTSIAVGEGPSKVQQDLGRAFFVIRSRGSRQKTPTIRKLPSLLEDMPCRISPSTLHGSAGFPCPAADLVRLSGIEGFLAACADKPNSSISYFFLSGTVITPKRKSVDMLRAFAMRMIFSSQGSSVFPLGKRLRRLSLQPILLGKFHPGNIATLHQIGKPLPDIAG